VISGVHAIIYARHPDEVRAFFRDILGLSHVDAGGDWPVFALPPAELGVHPTDGEENAELFLVCDDIEAAVAEMRAKGVRTAGPIRELDWGRLVTLEVGATLRIGMYEPKHPRPLNE
jgi:catechol 2,3-dioxygenase-like lactoylglutathione lyase family enzyme